MNPVLQNSFLQLTLEPGSAGWCLAPNRAGPVIQGARMQIGYRLGRSRRTALDRWQPASISEQSGVPSALGPLRQVTLHALLGPAGLQCDLTFALPDEHPCLLWRISLVNAGARPLHIDRCDLLRLDSSPTSRLAFPGPASPALAFFANGWQSWSYTGRYTPRDRSRYTRLGPLRLPVSAGVAASLPSRPGHFLSDMFGVLGDGAGRSALLAGFLSQRQHFGALEARLDSDAVALCLWADGDGARLDPEAHLETDWACLFFIDIDSPDPLGPYLEAVAREHGLSQADGPHPAAVPTGWCSWYQYSSAQYTGAVSAADIRRNLEAITALRPRLPLEVVQIDDGFQAEVGDWFEFSPAFPDGVAPLAAEIRLAGFTPGLWLAPFIVDPRSRLFAEHPGWLLGSSFRRPANAAFNWGRFAAALDLTNPAALEYAAGVVRTAVHEWGFPYLKLDFLYAAALPGRRHDPTRTRAQALRLGLQAVREAAGSAYLVGCGCPLGPAVGLVDAMRIGADTARRWNPAFGSLEAFFRCEPDLPSARNAAHNTLTRAALHGRWWVNDPDCLLLRPAVPNPADPGAALPGAAAGRRANRPAVPPSALTLAEVQARATSVAFSGGSLILSDDLASLPEDRLRLAEALLPVIGRRSRLLDWFDEPAPRRLRLDLDGPAGPWFLLAFFNWDDRPQSPTLRLAEFDLDPQVDYLGREFWTGQLLRSTGGALPLPKIPAHGAALLALRPLQPDLPQYLGSDLHVSMGLEVTEWRLSPPPESPHSNDFTRFPDPLPSVPYSFSPIPYSLTFRLNRPGPAAGAIDLALPGSPLGAWLDGHPLAWHSPAPDCCRLPIAFERAATIQVRYR